MAGFPARKNDDLEKILKELAVVVKAFKKKYKY